MINIEDYIDTGKLFDGRYKILRALSTDGGTADVWLATDTTTIDTHIELEDDEVTTCQEEGSGMLVAIKVYRPKNALDIEGEQRFREEYKIVYECRHENLLQPTGFAICEEAPYLVLPYCQHGSSERFIGQRLATAEIWKFILDVSSGLNRLHTNEPPIIHQDIKPANVLIDNSNNFSITDFGISAKRGGNHGYYYDDENSGTLAYMAPERFEDGAVPIAESDIWAFGATLCEILTGKVPFGEEGGHNQIAQRMPMPKVNGVPADIVRLIHACLAVDPKKRPTAAEIRRAAVAQQFPVKKSLFKFSLAALLVVSLIGTGIAVSLLRHGAESTATLTPPASMPVEVFEETMIRYMDSDNPDSLQIGLNIMDSLAKQDYVPALYELACTYGWNVSPKSEKRKKILGIAVYDSSNHDIEYMPKEKSNNTKGERYYQTIIELADSSYATINAWSAYYYGLYMINPIDLNSFEDNSAKEQYKKNAREYFNQAAKWARVAGDTVLAKEFEDMYKKLF